MRATHVRETENPGAFDLLIKWEHRGSPRYCWLELKLQDKPLEPSQQSFLRVRGDGELLMIGRLYDDHIVKINTTEERELLWSADFRLAKWQPFFDRTYDSKFL